nr:hypothetical protein [Acholeplasmatales bacterium]
MEGYYDFKALSQTKISTYSSWYTNKQNETWDYIIKNLDIEPEYLEPNQYLGIYWDSYAYDKKDSANLYLIWTSAYLPSEFVNISQIKESGKVYNLYDSKEDMDNLKSNWFDSSYYHIKNSNITLWITPIAGIDDGKSYGIPIKSKYNFQGFTFGIDDAQFMHEPDSKHLFDGEVKSDMEFDFGEEPKNEGKNMMKLCTHAYEYITDIEAQSTYSLGFGGYQHFVHFNLSINPDKIYRVDVKYNLTNDNKEWYQFWLPNDEHTILKSLSPDKARGGFLGLFHYQGFKEGSFSSVSNPDRKFKYELLLDYDDQGWRWKIEFRRLLDIIYPGFDKIFENLYIDYTQALLLEYPHPEIIRKKRLDTIAKFIEKHTCHKGSFSLKQAQALKDYAENCASGCSCKSYLVSQFDTVIHTLNSQIKHLETTLD